MFTFVQNNKYRKVVVRNTRTIDTYVFDTDIVHLGIYANSPYYVGARLWNNLPLEIKNTRNKGVFSTLVQRH